MTRTIFSLLFITTLTGVFGQTLKKFEFSDCLRECIGDSVKINSVAQTNGLTKINLTTYAPCNGNLQGQIKLVQDTIDFTYSTKPTIIVNKKTGKSTELLEIADCDCIFKLDYTIKGLKSIDKKKIKINGETLDKINKKFFSSGEIKVEFDNDSIEGLEDVYLVVDNPAQFPGGFQSFYRDYIDKNIKYPKADITGRVFIEFIINTDGSIDDSTVIVVRGLNEYCNNEAIRLMKECPDWTPATIKNKPVKQKLRIPITFDNN